jgi:hypothetical protein
LRLASSGRGSRKDSAGNSSAREWWRESACPYVRVASVCPPGGDRAPGAAGCGSPQADKRAPQIAAHVGIDSLLRTTRWPRRQATRRATSLSVKAPEQAIKRA